MFGLAGDTQAHTGDGVTAPLGYGGVTFFAVFQALAARQLSTSACDGILDRCIDLILYRTVFRETACHRVRW